MQPTWKEAVIQNEARLIKARCIEFRFPIFEPSKVEPGRPFTHDHPIVELTGWAGTGDRRLIFKRPGLPVRLLADLDGPDREMVRDFLDDRVSSAVQDREAQIR